MPRSIELRLFCPCGEVRLFCGGLCARCYWSYQHSRRCFAGNRHQVLNRDENRCRACGRHTRLAVHHRKPGLHQPRWLITLCATCHARIHRLSTLRNWVEPALVPLWHEQHPDTPVQLQFGFEA